MGLPFSWRGRSIRRLAPCALYQACSNHLLISREATPTAAWRYLPYLSLALHGWVGTGHTLERGFFPSPTRRAGLNMNRGCTSQLSSGSGSIGGSLDRDGPARGRYETDQFTRHPIIGFLLLITYEYEL